MMQRWHLKYVVFRLLYCFGLQKNIYIIVKAVHKIKAYDLLFVTSSRQICLIQKVLTLFSQNIGFVSWCPVCQTL